MRVEYIKTVEPYAKGDVVEVSNEVAEVLVNNGTAKEVDSKTELKVQAVDAELNVAPGAQGKNAQDLLRRKTEALDNMSNLAEEDSEDISKMKLPELKALAESKGIVIPDGAKKDDVIALLNDADRS